MDTFDRVYTENDIRKNGDEYEIEVNGGILSGSSPRGLLRLANQVAKSKAKPLHFLEAWKDAIALIGESYFTITAPSVQTATDKYQLVPDFAAITESLGVVSGGERRFLIALYQFYNDYDIVEYCKQHEIERPTMSDLALLDDDHLAILTRLLHSYTGW